MDPFGMNQLNGDFGEPVVCIFGVHGLRTNYRSELAMSDQLDEAIVSDLIGQIAESDGSYGSSHRLLLAYPWVDHAV